MGSEVKLIGEVVVRLERARGESKAARSAALQDLADFEVIWQQTSEFLG